MTPHEATGFPLKVNAALHLNAVQTRLLNQYYRYCVQTRRAERPHDLTPSALLTNLLFCAVHADREFSAWVQAEPSRSPRQPPYHQADVAPHQSADTKEDLC